jgi:heterodisulfide reductase subunit A
MRLAQVLKHRQPQAEITIFYMDLQNIGRDAPQFEEEARREIKVVRALPGDLRAAADGSLRMRYLHEENAAAVEAAFDLVVLSVGIGPGADNAALAGLLQVELTATGFFSQTSQPGLFLAGTASGPKDIAGCLTQALAAARQASRYVQES